MSPFIYDEDVYDDGEDDDDVMCTQKDGNVFR